MKVQELEPAQSAQVLKAVLWEDTTRQERDIAYRLKLCEVFEIGAYKVAFLKKLVENL